MHNRRPPSPSETEMSDNTRTDQQGRRQAGRGGKDRRQHRLPQRRIATRKFLATGVKIRAKLGDVWPNEVVGRWAPEPGTDAHRLLKGRAQDVKFQSRRDVKPGDLVECSVLDMGGFMLAVVDEETCTIPIAPAIEITSVEQLQKATMKDWQGRDKFFHRESGDLCYLYFRLRELPRRVSEDRPLYLVGTKRAYRWICDDLSWVQLLSEYETEEGRLPDLTFMRTGKFVLHFIDWLRLKVGFRPEGQDEGWETCTEVSMHEALGIDPDTDIPSQAQIDEAYATTVAAYEILAPEVIGELLNNPCTETEVRLLAIAREHNLAKLRQIKRYLELRLDAHEVNLSLARGAAAKTAHRMADAFQQGGGLAGVKALKAPPVSAKTRALSAGTGQQEQTGKRKELPAPEAEGQWISAVREALPGVEKVGETPIEDYAKWLFRAAATAGSRVPSELDELPMVAVRIFQDAEFPRDHRWAVYAYIRKLQGMDENDIPSAIRVALEATEELEEDVLRSLTEEVTDMELVGGWYEPMETRRIGERKLRPHIAASLASQFSGTPAAAKRMDAAEIERRVQEAYNVLQINLGPRTRQQLLALVTEA